MTSLSQANNFRRQRDCVPAETSAIAELLAL
jgi:hypothetical protein